MAKPFLPFVFVAVFFSIKVCLEPQLQQNSHPTPITLETAKFYGNSLKRFSLGFDNLIADLQWITLLQGASHKPMEHSGVSWEYAKLNALTTLDPKFQKAYLFGAAFVSVFRRDKEGAKDLFQKWVLKEPLSWRAHTLLGFHLFHEMHDYANASKQILLAANLAGAPSWLSSLGIRLMSESGSVLASLQMAIELYPSLQDDEGRYRLRQRIRSLNYALQKKAWQKALERYRSRYAREPASLSQLSSFKDENPVDARLLSSEDPECRQLLGERFNFHYEPTHVSITSSDPSLEDLGIHREKGSHLDTQP